MNLKPIADEALIENTENLVRQENSLLVPILHHLIEIERRRLYCTLGFGSLFQYAVKRLKYSEDEAYRRISAMKLLRELPEIEAKIGSGQLSLTNLGMVKTLFARKVFSRAGKIEVLKQLEGKTTREAARIVAGICPEVLKADKIRPVSEDLVELKYLAQKEVEAKIDELKGILAHSHPNLSTGDLMNLLLDLGIKTWGKTAAPRDLSRQNSKAGIRRAVFARDKKCTGCGSGYALEIDHIVPRALGGEDSLTNLRLLCRKCNQRAAVEVYGVRKMGNFLRSPAQSYSRRWVRADMLWGPAKKESTAKRRSA